MDYQGRQGHKPLKPSGKAALEAGGADSGRRCDLHTIAPGLLGPIERFVRRLDYFLH